MSRRPRPGGVLRNVVGALAANRPAGTSFAPPAPGIVAQPSPGSRPSTRPPAAPPGIRRSKTRRSKTRRHPEPHNRRGVLLADFTGTAQIEYAPIDDNKPDPGEVVWTWVPYEDNPLRGKDRPVLVIGRDGPYLLAVMLTSKDHDHDVTEEAEAGRHWLDIGTGPWDKAGRPSEVRLDRILRIDPQMVRREGATLPRDTFDWVADAMRILHGW